MMSTSAGMTPACVIGREYRELITQNAFDVLSNSAFGGPVNSHTLGLELHQSTHPDASHHHTVHDPAAQSQERLAHAMRVMLIPVLDFLDLQRVRLNDDESRGGPKMAVNHAVETLKRLGWKTDLHVANSSHSIHRSTEQQRDHPSLSGGRFH
jgi:hypothetical protein